MNAVSIPQILYTKYGTKVLCCLESIENVYFHFKNFLHFLKLGSVRPFCTLTQNGRYIF